MAKKVSAGYRDIITAIRKKEFEPVYILMGEESYYIDLIVSNLEKYVVDDEDRDFNVNIFFGNDADIDYVIGAAQQFPVMADRKLVILKEGQAMAQAKSQLERFAPYVSKPNPNTVFVIIYKGEPFTASSKLMKAAKEGGAVVFTSNVPRDYEVKGHFKDFCADRKISIDDKAVDLMCEYIGTPLSKLFGELSKLVAITGGKKRISCDDVERNIGISKDFNNFELVNAISVRNYPKAVQIIKHFENNPKANPTVMTTATIFKYFSNLVIAHYMSDKSDNALKQEFGYKANIQLEGIRNGLARYNARQAVNAIHYIREFDTKSKGIGSMGNEYDLLREMIFKIST